MSWLFSQALVEEYLGDTCSDGEQSAPLSGSPTQLAYCAPDRMTKFSRLSRFGMTYKPLTEDRGEELLTSYLAAFPVRTSAPQERAQESTELGQECGSTWPESLARYDPDTSMWRTPHSLLSEESTEFSGTWPRWGSMQDGVSYQQPPLVLHTKGTVSGLLPTPLASLGTNGGPNQRDSSGRPGLQMAAMNWPTPRAQEPARTTKGYGRGLKELIEGKQQIERWPTPVTSDHAARRPTESWKGTSDLPSVVWTANGGTENPDKPAAKLNPTWVEWLMGWPLGWTDLKPLETDRFRSWQQQHGTCSPDHRVSPTEES